MAEEWAESVAGERLWAWDERVENPILTITYPRDTYYNEVANVVPFMSPSSHDLHAPGMNIHEDDVTRLCVVLANNDGLRPLMVYHCSGKVDWWSTWQVVMCLAPAELMGEDCDYQTPRTHCVSN